MSYISDQRPCDKDEMVVRIPIMGDGERLTNPAEPTVYNEAPITSFGNKGRFVGIDVVKDAPAPSIDGQESSDKADASMNAKWTRDAMRKTGRRFGLDAYMTGAGVLGSTYAGNDEVMPEERMYQIMRNIVQKNLPRSNTPSFERRTDMLLSKAGKTSGAAALVADNDGYGIEAGVARKKMYIDARNPWDSARSMNTGTFTWSQAVDGGDMQYIEYGESREDVGGGMHDTEKLVSVWDKTSGWGNKNLVKADNVGVRQTAGVTRRLNEYAPASGLAVRGHGSTGPSRERGVVNRLNEYAPSSGLAVKSHGLTGPTKEVGVVNRMNEYAPTEGLAVRSHGLTGPTKEVGVVNRLNEYASADGVTRRHTGLTNRYWNEADGLQDSKSMEFAHVAGAGFKGMDLSRQAHKWTGVRENADGWGGVHGISKRNVKYHDYLMKKMGHGMEEWDFGHSVSGVATEGKEYIPMSDDKTYVAPELPEVAAGGAGMDTLGIEDGRLYENDTIVRSEDDLRVRFPTQFM